MKRIITETPDLMEAGTATITRLRPREHFLRTLGAAWGGPWILRGALACQVLLVAWVCWSHDPRQSFDESNTLKIASLSASDRAAVLAHDPNLPAYYALVGRLLAAAGGSLRFVKVLQVSVWLATVLCFRRLAGRLAAEPRTALTATLLYALTASIYYYAFYVRMYGLALLALLLAFDYSVRYADRGRLRDLLGLGTCFLALALLHPTVVLICPLFLLALRWRTKDVGHLRVGFGFALGAAVLLGVQLAAKADIVRLYFGTAVEYIRSTSSEVLSRPWQLLFKHIGPYSWALSAAAAFLLYRYVRKGAWLRPRCAPVTVFVGAFTAAWLLASSFIDSHHYYFATPALILAMALGLESCTTSIPLRRSLEALVLVIFAAGSAGFLTRQREEARRSEVGCRTVSGLEDGWILTDYIIYNTIDRCLPSGCRVALFTPGGIVDTTSLGPRDLLIEQARMGGTCAASLALQAFQKQLSELTATETNRLRERIADLARERGNVYYMTSQTKRYLFPEELELFSGLTFKGMLRPAIFWFQDRGRGAEAGSR